ncbi:MAG: ornithine cyclodeaminase family protein [Armatimonadetes bacterium]|nr:ornithine cyclodeaminase family protein [Armatimonadota bacterium]
MGALYITAEETRRLVSPREVLNIVEEVFRWHAAGQIVWPQPRMFRMQVPQFSGRYHVKACCLLPLGVTGVRVVGYHVAEDGSGTSLLDNTRYVILNDPKTGRPLAIVDEHWNYSMRTSASACVATKSLLPPAPKVLGLVGVGAIGRTALLGMNELFPLREVRVTSRRPESREGFAQEMSTALGLRVVAVATPEEAVRGADAVFTGTTAGKTLVKTEWVGAGTVVCTLGSREVEESFYRAADKVIVDDWEQNRHLPEMADMIKRGAFSDDEVYAEIADIVSGKKPGRSSPQERILVRTEGLVTQDVAVAYHTYLKAKEVGAGLPLP